MHNFYLYLFLLANSFEPLVVSLSIYKMEIMLVVKTGVIFKENYVGGKFTLNSLGFSPAASS